MGNSFTVRAIIVFFSGLSCYNGVELVLLIFFTFSRFRGLYFWSLLISSICTVLHALGFLFKFNLITQGDTKWLAIVLVILGWVGMVSGQSLVLWSRLHLLVDRGEKGRRTLRWTKWMIITNAIVLHSITAVLTFGSNGDIATDIFVKGYNVMEKIQMAGFFIQEVILSSLYIKQASALLKTSQRADTKKFFIQLLGINVLIILMDLGLLATEAASLYLYEAIIKSTVYSIKLKLEFAILGKLIHFAGGRPGNSAANEERWRRFSANVNSESHTSETKVAGDFDVQHNEIVRSNETSKCEFGLRKTSTNLTFATTNSATLLTDNRRRRSGCSALQVSRGISEDDIDFACFEHYDNANLPGRDYDAVDSKV